MKYLKAFLVCFFLTLFLPSCTRAPHRFERPIVKSHSKSISERKKPEPVVFLEPDLIPIEKEEIKPIVKSPISQALVPPSKTENKPSKPLAKPIASSKKVSSQTTSYVKKEAPVVKTTKNKQKGPLIVLDAGHGGKDTGAKSTKNAYEEKILTLQTVNLIKGYLTKMGYEVSLTRKNDAYVDLEKRAEIANDMKAALFVSIHYNYCPNVEAEGIEIFYYKDEKNPYTKRLIESRKLGDIVLSGIVKHTGATPRGVKRANFAVVRETKMPAILIEGGFLSNSEERKKILDVPYRQFLAFGIASGIDRYLNQN